MRADAEPSLGRFYAVALDPSLPEIEKLLDEFARPVTAPSSLAMALRGLRTGIRGDTQGAISLLKRAVDTSPERARDYILDLLVPFLVTANRFGEAEQYSERAGNVRQLRSGQLATRAIIAALQGRTKISAQYEQEALDELREVDNPIVRAGSTAHGTCGIRPLRI
jgi:hypothetical protein